MSRAIAMTGDAAHRRPHVKTHKIPRFMEATMRAGMPVIAQDRRISA